MGDGRSKISAVVALHWADFAWGNRVRRLGLAMATADCGDIGDSCFGRYSIVGMVLAPWRLAALGTVDGAAVQPHSAKLVAAPVYPLAMRVSLTKKHWFAAARPIADLEFVPECCSVGFKQNPRERLFNCGRFASFRHR